MFFDRVRVLIFVAVFSMLSAQVMGATLVAKLVALDTGQHRLTVLSRGSLDVNAYRLSIGDKAFLYSEESEPLNCRTERFSVVRVYGFVGGSGNYVRRDHFLAFGEAGDLRAYLVLPESEVGGAGFLAEGGKVGLELCLAARESFDHKLPVPELEPLAAPVRAGLIWIEGDEYLLYLTGSGRPKVLVQADGGAELRLMDHLEFECEGRRLLVFPVQLNFPRQGGAKLYRYFVFEVHQGVLQAEGVLMDTGRDVCSEICAGIDDLEPVESR